MAGRLWPKSQITEEPDSSWTCGCVRERGSPQDHQDGKLANQIRIGCLSGESSNIGLIFATWELQHRGVYAVPARRWRATARFDSVAI